MTLRKSPSGPNVAGLTLYDQFGAPVDLSIDAFQRLRVSNPATQFDSKQVYSDGGALFDIQNSGGSAVYTNARASTLLSVTGAGQSVIRQSRRYMSYQPGKSTQIFMTGVMTAGGQVGVVKSMGYFDASNGCFFRLNGLTPEFVVRSNVTGVVLDDAVPQDEWNFDKLDGQGPSGYVLKPSAAQVFALDFEWLGVGPVRMGFIIGGVFVKCHTFEHANIDTSVYMQTPNLPVRWEITSTGGTGSLECICCSVVSEGGQDLIGKRRTAGSNAARVVPSSAINSLVQIRNRSGQFLRAPMFPLELSCMCSTTGQGQWLLIINPTVTAGVIAWNNVSTNESSFEFDIGGTTITAGTGTIVNSGFFSSDTSVAASQLREALNFGASIDGLTRDVLCLAVRNLNAANESYYGSITWLEPT